MKKRLFFTAAVIGILTIAMSVTVCAGGGGGISTYEELIEFMESEQGGSLWGITPAEDFGWPEGEITLTFDDWRGLSVWDDWTIPENVTIIANDEFRSYGATVTVDGTLICSGLTNQKFKPAHNVQNPDKTYQTTYAGTNLIVNGRVSLGFYQDDRFFQNIVVNDGGELTVRRPFEPDEFSSMFVDESGSLTVKEGGMLSLSRLTVYGKAEFSNRGYMEGLTAPTGTVIITETGEISCEMMDQLRKAEIAGELYVFSSLGLSIYETEDKNDGEIELKETGKLHLLPEANMFRNNTGTVNGTGTLCVYGWTEDDFSGRPQIFGTSLYGWPENASIEGVSSGVTIRANWKQPAECEHTFVKSPYAVESRCTDGYTVYLCSACDEPVRRDIVPASVPHSWRYQRKEIENGDYYYTWIGEDGLRYRSKAIIEYTAIYYCGYCYQDKNITLTADDAVYTGESIETAVLTDETGVIASDVEIIYTDNTGPGVAKATVLLPKGVGTETVEIHVNFRIEEAPAVEIPDREELELLNQYLAGWPVEVGDLKALDFNHDGRTNRKDAMCIARYLAGWPAYKLPNH